ncbi:MAG TPA: hypothetical protein VGH66_17440, partial [Acidimicrobiales bacterium]
RGAGRADHPGHRGPSGLPPTILFAAIALVVWLGARIAAAHARRRGWLFILAGIGVCLVPLWFAFENVIRLLPANI